MQIFHWIFKLADKEASKGGGAGSKGVDLHLLDRRRAKRKKKLRSFENLSRRDVAEACFYSSTIYLRRLGSSRRRQHWARSMKMKKETSAKEMEKSAKIDSITHGGSKVLPLGELLPTDEHRSSTEKKEKPKGDRTKTLSRMKELLRSAAAAKLEKGGKFIGRKVLQFRGRGALKAVPDDDQLSNESPKISFRWDLESCSTVSSAYTVTSSLRNTQTCNPVSVNSTPVHDRDHHYQFNPKKGNWITTDSEFVVLEL